MVHNPQFNHINMNFKQYAEGVKRPRRKRTIKWIRHDPEDPTDTGCTSEDGRFDIEPIYLHKSTPTGAWLHDNLTKKKYDCHGGNAGARWKAEAILNPPPPTPPPTEEEKRQNILRAWRMGVFNNSNLNGEFMMKVKAKAEELGVNLPDEEETLLAMNGWKRGPQSSGTAAHVPPYQKAGKFLHQDWETKKWILQHAPGFSAPRTTYDTLRDALANE